MLREGSLPLGYFDGEITAKLGLRKTAVKPNLPGLSVHAGHHRTERIFAGRMEIATLLLKFAPRCMDGSEETVSFLCSDSAKEAAEDTAGITSCIHFGPRHASEFAEEELLLRHRMI